MTGLLHPNCRFLNRVVQFFCRKYYVLARTRDAVSSSELARELPGLPKLAENVAVEIQLVEAARDSVHAPDDLVRTRCGHENAAVCRESDARRLIERAGTGGAMLDDVRFPGLRFRFLPKHHLQPCLLVEFHDEIAVRVDIPDVVLRVDGNTMRRFIDIEPFADEANERTVRTKLHPRVLASVCGIDVPLRVESNAHAFAEIYALRKLQRIRVRFDLQLR
jgi:hypothetical protein